MNRVLRERRLSSCEQEKNTLLLSFERRPDMGIDFTMTITDRNKSEEFIEFYRGIGVPLVFCILGRGTATGEILDYLGLEASEKSVLIGMVPQHRAREFVHMTRKTMWLDVPGNGILLTVPVASMGSAKTMRFLVDDEQIESGGEIMEKEHTHELIVVVTNQGYTDFVMDAARSKGAAGGTMVHAKGTGMEIAKKFFGVSIAEEKEMIFIVAPAADRRAIMQEVIDQAGVRTKAQSLVFSLPVSAIAGLRQVED